MQSRYIILIVLIGAALVFIAPSGKNANDSQAVEETQAANTSPIQEATFVTSSAQQPAMDAGDDTGTPQDTTTDH